MKAFTHFLFVTLGLCTLTFSLPGYSQPGGRGRLPLPGGNTPPPAPVDWQQLQWLAIGTLDSVQEGPTMKSFPPIYNHTLSLTLDDVLRGSFASGANISAHHSARQHERPSFPATGKRVIVGGKMSRSGDPVVMRIEAATPAQEQTFRMQVRLPLGWNLQEGKPVSPWAAVPGYSWNASVSDQVLRCSVSGQPASMLPRGVTWDVVKVPPETDIKWTNPDGDGFYRLVLSNTGNQPVPILGLLRDGDTVRWDAAVAIQHKGASQTLPGVRPVPASAVPVTLEPGASIETQMDLFRLNVPAWPRGGYRIEFLISMGGSGKTVSFYYLSRHHDALRAKRSNSGK